MLRETRPIQVLLTLRLWVGIGKSEWYNWKVKN